MDLLRCLQVLGACKICCLLRQVPEPEEILPGKQHSCWRQSASEVTQCSHVISMSMSFQFLSCLLQSFPHEPHEPHAMFLADSPGRSQCSEVATVFFFLRLLALYLRQITTNAFCVLPSDPKAPRQLSARRPSATWPPLDVHICALPLPKTQP